AVRLDGEGDTSSGRLDLLDSGKIGEGRPCGGPGEALAQVLDEIHGCERLACVSTGVLSSVGDPEHRNGDHEPYPPEPIACNRRPEDEEAEPDAQALNRRQRMNTAHTRTLLELAQASPLLLRMPREARRRTTMV